MKNRRRVVLAALATAVVLLGGFLLREFLLAYIVKPVALLAWIGSRLISSVDQAAYWAGLILLLLMISLPRLARQWPARNAAQEKAFSSTQNSVAHWRTLILLSADQMGRHNLLQRNLQMLLKDLYASIEPLEVPWKRYQDVEQGEIQLPDSIRVFLGLDPPQPRPSLMQRLRRPRPAAGGGRRVGARQSRSEYFQSVEEVIAFMEKELENEYDR